MLGLCVLAVVAAGCSSPSTPNAATLLATAQRKALNAYSVSYRLVATGRATTTDPHPTVETVVAELSAPTAVQSLRTTSGAGDLDAMLVDGIVYFRGDAHVLETALGLSVVAADHFAAQWLSIPDSNDNFAAITGNLTPSSQLTPLFPTGAVTIGSEERFHGREVWPVSGTAAADSSRRAGVTRMLIDAHTLLPVASGIVAVSTSGQQFSEVASFRAWGGHVDVTAPQGAIPIAIAIAYRG
jgi:hypothetical protein